MSVVAAPRASEEICGDRIGANVRWVLVKTSFEEETMKETIPWHRISNIRNRLDIAIQSRSAFSEEDLAAVLTEARYAIDTLLAVRNIVYALTELSAEPTATVRRFLDEDYSSWTKSAR